MDSFSPYWNVRISNHKAPVRETGKNAKQNRSRRSFQSPFMLLMTRVYHCFAASTGEKGNNFHLSVPLLKSLGMSTIAQIHPGDDRAFHYLSPRRIVPEPWLNSRGWVHSHLKWLDLKRLVAHKTHPYVRRAIEGYCSMCSGGIDRIKENGKDTMTI